MNAVRISAGRTLCSVEWELRQLCEDTEEALEHSWQETKALKQKNEASMQEIAVLKEKILLSRQKFELSRRRNGGASLSSGHESDLENQRFSAHNYSCKGGPAPASEMLGYHKTQFRNCRRERLMPKIRRILSLSGPARLKHEEDLKVHFRAMEHDMEFTARELQSSIHGKDLACNTLKRTVAVNEETIISLRCNLSESTSSRQSQATGLRTQLDLLSKKAKERDSQIQELQSKFEELFEIEETLTKRLLEKKIRQGDISIQYEGSKNAPYP